MDLRRNIQRIENKTVWGHNGDFIRDEQGRLIALNRKHPYCFGDIDKHIVNIFGEIFDKEQCKYCTLEMSCKTAAFHDTKKFKEFSKASRRALYKERYRVSSHEI